VEAYARALLAETAEIAQMGFPPAPYDRRPREEFQRALLAGACQALKRGEQVAAVRQVPDGTWETVEVRIPPTCPREPEHAGTVSGRRPVLRLVADGHQSPVAHAAATATATATAGNLDPLHRFTDHGLSDDQLISANLNYLAYWSGENATTWNADSAMTRPAASTWNGTLLLKTLLRGIVHAPYRDLCAHTLWALLLLRRPQLTSPQQLTAIKTAVSHALQARALTPSARQRLEQVSHFARSA